MLPKRASSSSLLPLGKKCLATKICKEVFLPKGLNAKTKAWAALGCTVLDKYAAYEAPLIIGKLTDKVALDIKKDGDSQDLWDCFALAAQYTLWHFLTTAARELRSVLFTEIAQKAAQAHAETAFAKLQRCNLGELLEEKSGEMYPLIEKGSQAINNLMTNLMYRVLPLTIDLMSLLFFSGKGGPLGNQVLSGKLGLSTLLSYSLFTAWYSERRIRYRLENGRATRALNGMVQEALLNAETTRMFDTAISQLENEKFESKRGAVTKSMIKVNRSLGLLNAGQQLILHVALFASIFRNIDKAFRNGTTGQLVSAAHRFNHIVRPLNFLGTMYRETKTGIADYTALEKVLSSINERNDDDDDDMSDLQIKGGAVTFSNVNFSYAKSESKVLENLNLKIHGGSHVALVGPSGAGKSTIVRTLLRLYEGGDGSISIDEQPIENCSIDSLRKSIGVVPQEVILFNESLLYNIKYGAPEASKEEVEEVCRIAQLEDVIDRLPEGWDSKVGERGALLSGGERQRVGIARCLLKKPRILILDEATSNMDVATEKRINSLLKETHYGRTTIVIAHRLASITNVDQIFYLENGSIQEQGTHEELLELGGKYATLWEQQKSIETPGAPSKLKREMAKQFGQRGGDLNHTNSDNCGPGCSD